MVFSFNIFFWGGFLNFYSIAQFRVRQKTIAQIVYFFIIKTGI